MSGTLLIAGGNVGATDRGRKEIYGRFTELCGGKGGKLILAVCAGEDPEDSYAYYRDLFLQFGVGTVELLPLTLSPSLIGKGNWTDRADETLLPILDGATGVWFTGGDQLRTAKLLLNPDGTDTPVLKRMRSILDAGGAIGGSSAGAAIMSRTMILRGDDEGTLTLPHYTDIASYPDGAEGSPEPLLIGRGLGFLPHGVVDQHFNRRARLQRLLATMQEAGEDTGYGIGEDTALEVSLDTGKLRVLGSAYVMRITRTEERITLETLTAEKPCQ